MNRSRRAFKSGLVLMAVFAMAHLAGFLKSAHAARTRPEMEELTRLMRATRSSVLGFHPSILDFREYFSLNFSILMLLAAGLGHAVTRRAPESVEFVQALSPIYALGMFFLFWSSVFFSVIQGMITCAILTVLFWLASRRSVEEEGTGSGEAR